VIRCLHCGAETSNGLALCELCRKAVLVNLEFIGIYFRNLSRWRPGRAGTRDVPGSREPRIPPPSNGDAVSRTLDESHADLTGWARSLSDDRPGMTRVIERIMAMDEEPCARLLCALFARRMMSLSTLEWVGEFASGTRRMEFRLRALTERVVPGWYAGACRHCATPTFVLPGITWVTCQGCGAMTYAADHLDVVLEEARKWVARPKPLAEALVALVDTEMSVPRLYERIHKWGQRERITPIVQMRRAHVFDIVSERIVVGEEQIGFARYRFGEVFDALMTDGATRIEPQQTPREPQAC
jgi:hypothetical protein